MAHAWPIELSRSHRPDLCRPSVSWPRFSIHHGRANRPDPKSQLSFEFAPPQEPASLPTANTATTQLTPEEMAQRLESHPDFRVLRRLVPVLDYGVSPNGHDVDSTARRVLVLDTETTGLSHAGHQIIELAMLLVQVDPATGQPFGRVETFEGFEDPGMPIPEVARQVTGITDEMVRGHHLDDARVEDLLGLSDSVAAIAAGGLRQTGSC